ncbi:MAG: hypothetical protein WA947_08450 [Phormidesmis sp.]|mgnify:CR=1 FL=1
MRKILGLGLAAATLLAIAFPANALTKIEITEQTAQETVPEINVPGGHSVLLNFENGRYIQSILIDDPRILGVATDRALCTGQSSGDCGFASAVRLTQLSGAIDLPGASFSQGNGLATVVSVMTTDRSGQDSEVYQFLVNTTGSVTSNVSMVSIVPSTGAEDQDVYLPDISASSGRTDFDLSSIEAGHGSALSQGLANTESEAWQALEQFLKLVEDGTSITEAITRTGVSTVLLGELERIGSVAQI